MNEYELVVVAQPELDEDGMTALNDRIADWIKTAQGEITATEVWGRRQLAYPIRKYREGIYVLRRLQLPPSATATLERSLRLNEAVLRHLLIRREA
jgi:small subunit ribosomal protein S6